MLDQLLQIVQQNGQQAVVENAAVPNEQNQAVLQEASNSIMAGLQSMLAEGKGQDVMSLLQGDGDHGTGNPAVSQMTNNFMNNITEKFGISKDAAGGIANNLIPSVIGSLISKVKAGGNGGGFDLSGIIGSLTAKGGSGGSFNDIINNVGGALGLDKNKDGKLDMGDLGDAFSGFFGNKK